MCYSEGGDNLALIADCLVGVDLRLRRDRGAAFDWAGSTALHSINLSDTEPAQAIAARNDANEQEHVESYIVQADMQARVVYPGAKGQTMRLAVCEIAKECMVFKERAA